MTGCGASNPAGTFNNQVDVVSDTEAAIAASITAAATTTAGGAYQVKHIAPVPGAPAKMAIVYELVGGLP